MVRQRAYIGVTLSIFAITILLKLFGPTFDLVNIALIYLLPVVLSAVYGGKGPSYYAAAMGVLAFDFFFVPPQLSFTVADLRYTISFAVFLAVAALTGSLAARLKEQLEFAKQREALTASLYAMSKEMNAISDLNALLDHVSKQVAVSIGTEASIYLPNVKDELELAASSASPNASQGDAEMVIVKWVYRHGASAGKGTATLRESSGLYIPLRSEDKTYGVLGVYLGGVSLSHETSKLLEALGEIAASALARLKFGEEARLAQLTAESEKLRGAILDSVSHELRTPLASIIGSASALIEGDELFSTTDRMDLLATIREGALRMNRLVTNLLGMAQLESGMLSFRSRWCDVVDIIGIVLKHVDDFKQDRNIVVKLPDDVPLILGDESLLEQVLVNVVSNAIKYSPNGSNILVELSNDLDQLYLSVADEGMGILANELDQIFEKFYRSDNTKHVTGTGLGLAICKGIVELHGGTIKAKPNVGKGTVVTITLPYTANIEQTITIQEKEAE